MRFQGSASYVAPPDLMPAVNAAVTLRRLGLLLLLLFALPAAALEQVALQLNWKHQFQFAGYYAAVEKGYYREAGFEVKLVEADGHEDPIAAVIGGKAQYGVGASELALRRARGEPVVALAVILQHSPLVLLARRNGNNSQSIHDLAGKRIMLMPHETELFAYLRREGVTAYTPLPHSFHVGDLIEGRTDAISAYQTDEPFPLQQARFPYDAFSPRSNGIDFYGDTLFTTEAQIDKDADRVKAFREASLRGWHYAMKHPAEIADLIRARYSKRHSREHLLFEAAEMARLMQVDLVDIGTSQPGRWQHVAETYVEVGMLAAPYSIDGLLWDPNPREVPRWLLPAVLAALVVLLASAAIAWRFRLLSRRLAAEIGERETAQQRQQAVQRNLLALLDSTENLTMLIAADGTILSINTAGAARFDGTPETVAGHNIFDISPPDIRAARRQAVAQALGERRSIVIDDERGGMHLHNTLVPVIDADGEARRVAVFSENITERVLAHEALKKSEERYRFLAENTADVVWQTDAGMNFTYINEADERLRGVPRSEVIGTPFGRSLTPASQETARAINDARLAAERRGERTGTLTFQLEQLRRDGGTLWVEVNSTPKRNEAGEIVGYFGVSRDITERKRIADRLLEANAELQQRLDEIHRLQSALQEQAIRDSLTGLYNRRYLDETLEREIARAKREGHPLALVMIDVDHFKPLNDTYGHQAGDHVLAALGALLREDTRAEDVPCRYGGEEFLVLMPQMPLDAARERAEHWRTRFADQCFIHGSLSIRATISLGVAAYPNHGHTRDEIIQSADLALYLAKHDGRNRVAVFEAAPLAIEV